MSGCFSVVRVILQQLESDNMERSLPKALNKFCCVNPDKTITLYK